MIEMKDVAQKKVFISRNCGVKLRSKKESMEIIRQNLEQLKTQGLGQSQMAKMYMAMLNASDGMLN